MQTTLLQKGIAVSVIVLIFITQITYAIPSQSIHLEKDRNSNLLMDNNTDEKPGLINSICWPGLIKFNSNIDLDCNISELNKPVPFGTSVTVPITVTYWTEIPQLFWSVIWPINALILFFRFRFPMQKIFFESSDVPDGVKSYFSLNPVIIDIPFEGEIRKVNTSLIMSVIGKNALSTFHRIELNAFCKNIGRLEGTERKLCIEFFIEYSPCLYISAPPVSITPRNQTTVIPINVTNCGNWLTRVHGEIFDFPEDFDIILVPSNQDIEIYEKEEFFLIVTPPSDFTGYELIHLKFLAKRNLEYPNSPIGNYSYYLVIEVI